MRHKRTRIISYITAAIGLASLLAIPAHSQQARPSVSISASLTSNPSIVAFHTSAPTSVKTLVVVGNEQFRLPISSSGVTACQEFPAGSLVALEDGSGWEPNVTKTVNVQLGSRLDPAPGKEKFLVIRCLSKDQKSVVSDSVRVVRK